MNRAREIAAPRLKRGKRAMRADETRRTLFNAAATVVGKRGYEGASVSEITRLAGVASGTFYNYFETRQKLFDRLLPAVGDQLLDYIRSRSLDGAVGVEREELRITAYFEFFDQNPGFLRILNEAEVFAPQAFKQHIRNVASHYVNALTRHFERGEFGPYSREEIETIVYILMGARSYLTMLRRNRGGESRRDSGKSLIATYMKLVKGGLFAAGQRSRTNLPGVALGSAKPVKRRGDAGFRVLQNPGSDPA